MGKRGWGRVPQLPQEAMPRLSRYPSGADLQAPKEGAQGRQRTEDGQGRLNPGGVQTEGT